MDNKNAPTQATYFKYQFTKTMLSLAIAVLALCLAGISVSLYRIVTFGIREFLDVLQSPLLIAICLLCIILVIAMLVKSQYVIDEHYFTTQFGFIKSKYLIKDITALELDSDAKKLTVRMGENFSVLSLNEKWQDEFITAIRKVKPDIDFTFTLTDGKEN